MHFIGEFRLAAFAARAAAGLGLALALFSSCTRSAPPSPEPAARIESSGLGLAIAALPHPFTVAVNNGARLELTAPGEARLVFALGPEQRAGVNLVEQVTARKAWFEEAEERSYFGNRELMTPIGTAYTARGTYPAAGGPVEETWVFAVHPSANRLLTLTYTYPTGQSQERVQQLIAVLGEIEGLGFPTEPAPEGEKGAEP